MMSKRVRRISTDNRVLATGAAALAAAMLVSTPAQAAPIEGAEMWVHGNAGVYTDAGITAAADGDRVQQWSDLSGTGTHATATGGGTTAEDNAFRPTYVASDSNFNGQAVLSFFNEEDGKSQLVFDVSAKTVFYVYRRATITERVDNFNGTNQWNFHNINQTGYTAGWLNPGILTGGPVHHDTNPHMYTYWSDSSQPRRELMVDGGLKGTNIAAFTDGNINVMGGSGGSTGYTFKGEVAEVIIYNESLNLAQRRITENYLSAKYALPMNAATDFYAGDNPENGNYDIEVAGIGREADGKQSSGKSGGLTITESTAHELQVGQYVLAGHANQTHSINSDSGDPFKPAGIDQRWERVWAIDFTNDAGAVLTFDFDAAGLAAEFDESYDYRLLVFNLGTFSMEDAGLVASIVGNQVSFTLPAGDFGDSWYTLGAVIPEPASILLLLPGALAMLPRRTRRPA